MRHRAKTKLKNNAFDHSKSNYAISKSEAKTQNDSTKEDFSEKTRIVYHYQNSDMNGTIQINFNKQDSLAKSEQLVEPEQLIESKQSIKSDQTIVKTPESLQDSYLFIRQLGHGSQAKVFLAVRLADGKNVAVKQLNIGSVKTWKEYDLFHREAQLLESLDIDGVAKFYEAIECLDDRPPCSYIVQEYIEGYSLGQMLKDGHRFKVTDICDIIYQLLLILKQLQDRPAPVVHRDIKPSNILLKPGIDGYKATLIDFGAVANPQVQSGGSTVAGTYGYMPPEQLMGKPEPASDIYSLAAVAVYLISGRSPADMPIKDFHLIFEPDMQNMPPAVVNTLRSMLEPDPEKRLCDYETIYDLFENFQNDIFASTGSRQKVMTPAEFNEALEKVQFYGQSGNIELWQELSDLLPREDRYIPELYKELTPVRGDQINSDGISVFDVTSFHKNGTPVKRKISKIPYRSGYAHYRTGHRTVRFSQNPANNKL